MVDRTAWQGLIASPGFKLLSVLLFIVQYGKKGGMVNMLMHLLTTATSGAEGKKKVRATGIPHPHPRKTVRCFCSGVQSRKPCHSHNFLLTTQGLELGNSAPSLTEVSGIN